jgi:hypothetical protein
MPLASSAKHKPISSNERRMAKSLFRQKESGGYPAAFDGSK